MVEDNYRKRFIILQNWKRRFSGKGNLKRMNPDWKGALHRGSIEGLPEILRTLTALSY